LEQGRCELAEDVGFLAKRLQSRYRFIGKLFGEFAWHNFPERIEIRNWIRKIVWAA